MQKLRRVCLVHYHEVGLKGKNRTHFEHLLIDNLYFALKDICDEANGLRISRISGHELVEFPSEIRPEAVFERIRQVPGVARVSLAYKTELDFSAFTRAAKSALSEALPADSFKVSAKRSNASFEMHTMDLNREVGAVLVAAFPEVRVDVHTPDVEVKVLINQDAAYVWAKSAPGVGGLPVGSAEKCVALFSSGFDSPVATWMMGRRGAPMVALHFSGRPQVSAQSEELCQALVQALKPAGMLGRLYVVVFGNIQKEVALAVPEDLRIIMYRRLMFKIAEHIAATEGAFALVTGESLGQVASQTLENIWATSEVVQTVPVLRPLIGTDKQEIIDRARTLGTYEISSEVAPDACTLFMPKHPETHASFKRVAKVWDALPVDTYLEQAVQSLEYVDFGYCRTYRSPKVWAQFHSELSPVL